MDIGIAILALTLLALVVRFVGAPLLDRREPDVDDGEREALEAAREAKYREIRDLELDFLTGKLSTEDYEATNAQLRSEAIQILDRLEREQGESADSEGESADSEGESVGSEGEGPDSEGEGAGSEGEGARSGAGPTLRDGQDAGGGPEPEGDGVRPRDA